MANYALALRVLLLACITATAGCTANLRRERALVETSTTQTRPISEPVRAITGFSDGIACMDRMLRDNHQPTTMITSKIIPDASGKAPVATKDMIITALSEMSRTSNAFRVVDFEIDPLHQDTVQTLTSLMLPSGQLSIPKPQVYISGAISYVDQNVLINNSGVGASAKNWEFGYSKDIITTIVGVELHIGEFNTRTLFPGIDSSNELVAGNIGVGLDAGARIKKAGVQFTVGSTISQGVGSAVRTLVDLGMIELVGKWARVPYWECLALDQAHPEFQRQLLEWFDDLEPVARVRLFETGLHTLGYYTGEVDGRQSPALKEAISRFQSDHNATASGNLNFETYERLMKNYVASDGGNGFVRIGWGNAATSGGAFATVPRAGAPEFASAQVQPIGVRISLPRRENRFQLGDSLLLNVSLSETAWLYCYYQDAKGQISQVYPSSFQPTEPVQANRSVLIPDITNPNSFSIDLTRAGKEAATCFAVPRDLGTDLASTFPAKPLETIGGIATLAQLGDRFREAARAPTLGSATSNWEITK
jgi:peptidoglycan hydrolase-like protein with peptidoglycan-binding domain